MLLRSQVVNPVFEKLPETRVRGSVGGETARRGLTEMCFPRRRRVCHRFWMMGGICRRAPSCVKNRQLHGQPFQQGRGLTGQWEKRASSVKALCLYRLSWPKPLAEVRREVGALHAVLCTPGWLDGRPAVRLRRCVAIPGVALPTMIGRDGFEGRLQETDLQPPMARDLPLSC